MRGVDLQPRILLIQRSLPPDHSAAGALAMDLAMGLSKRGANVTLLGGGNPSTEPSTNRQPRVLRAGELSFRTNTIVGRVCALPSIHARLAMKSIAAGSFDAVITTSDPPLIACWATLLTRLRQSRQICWVQDLYPETAQAAGIFRETSFVYRQLRAAHRLAMRLADRIIVVGRCMQEAIEPIQSQVVLNWSRVSCHDQHRRRRGKFRILYSGNLGRAHDFSAPIVAAKLASDQKADWEIVFSGNGPKRAEIERAAGEIKNLKVVDPVDWAEYPTHLSEADAHLITLGKSFEGLVVPSKLYDAANSGRPVLFVGPRGSETARAITESGMGYVVRPDDPIALLKAINQLRENPPLRAEMEQNARNYAKLPRRQSAINAFWAATTGQP